MSKLLKLKDWLTLDDAAKHLSIMFGEDVTKADVLRLALDGKLNLSVNLVNGARARCGPLVSAEKAEFFEFPGIMSLGTASDYPGGYVKVPKGVLLNNGEVIELADDIVSLRGIYGLPMIGNERMDVEHEYQFLTDGPSVTLSSFDGTFVTAGDGTYCQLQESYDDNKFISGSAAQGRELEARIENEGLDIETANELRAKHKANREQFKKRRAEGPAEDNYFPAGGLPTDSVLVVRSAALSELQESASAPDRRDAALTHTHNTLLKLVIGMAIEGYGYSPDAPRSRVPADIASDLVKLGMSMTDDTVRKWLKEAAEVALPKKPK